MKTLRTIHVGVAARAKAHLKAMVDHPGFQPVAGVDVLPEVFDAASRDFGIPRSTFFRTVGEALRAVEADAVVIASPVVFHGEQIEAALEAGRHVMVEKPFTIDLRQAERAVAAAERRGLKIMVTQNMRYLPALFTLRRLLRERAYGEAGYFNLIFHKFRPQPYNDSPHQQLWQMSVHELDVLRAVIGAATAPRGGGHLSDNAEVTRVSCRENSPPWTKYPTAPAAMAVIEFAGGVSGVYLGSSDSKANAFELRVECADAALIQRGYNKDLFVSQGRQPEERKLDLDPLPLGMAADHDRLMAHLFYEYVINNAEPDISGRNNLGTMRLVDACIRSAETGAAVRVG